MRLIKNRVMKIDEFGLILREYIFTVCLIAADIFLWILRTIARDVKNVCAAFKGYTRTIKYQSVIYCNLLIYIVVQI